MPFLYGIYDPPGVKAEEEATPPVPDLVHSPSTISDDSLDEPTDSIRPDIDPFSSPIFPEEAQDEQNIGPLRSPVFSEEARDEQNRGPLRSPMFSDEGQNERDIGPIRSPMFSDEGQNERDIGPFSTPTFSDEGQDEQVQDIDELLEQLDQDYIRRYFRNMILEIVKRTLPVQTRGLTTYGIMLYRMEITDEQFELANIPVGVRDLVREQYDGWEEETEPLIDTSGEFAYLLALPGREHLLHAWKEAFEVAYGVNVGYAALQRCLDLVVGLTHGMRRRSRLPTQPGGLHPAMDIR